MGPTEERVAGKSSKENHKQTPVLGEVFLSLVSVAFAHERERVLVEVFSGQPFTESSTHFCVRIKKIQKMLDRPLRTMLY